MKRATKLLTSMILFFIFSCESTEPEVKHPEDKISLEILNIQPEEISLKFISTMINVTDTILVYRSDMFPEPLTTFFNTVAETTIVDKNGTHGLEWNTTYSYYAEIKGKTNKVTETVTASTGEPDSTTQNFTFQLFELGDEPISNSVANGAWVFDENNIWVVGTFYIKNGEYNVIKWNGTDWIPHEQYISSLGVNAIWAANENDIFIATGTVRRYDGNEFVAYDLSHLEMPRVLHYICGIDENNVWAANRGNALIHFDGTEWNKISVPDNHYIYSLSVDKERGKVYLSGLDFSGGGYFLAEADGSEFRIIYEIDEFEFMIPDYVHYEDNILYCYSSNQGSVLWRYNVTTGTKEQLPVDMMLWTTINDGHFENRKDIYITGVYGDGTPRLLHYNGKRGRIFTPPGENIFSIKSSHGIKNLTVACGLKQTSQSYILFIKRAL